MTLTKESHDIELPRNMGRTQPISPSFVSDKRTVRLEGYTPIKWQNQKLTPVFLSAPHCFKGEHGLERSSIATSLMEEWGPSAGLKYPATIPIL